MVIGALLDHRHGLCIWRDTEKKVQLGLKKREGSMSDKPGKIEHYEKQFGIIAIEKGFITAENLIETLKIQIEEELENKTHRLIGEILLDKGYITPTQIQDVLDGIFSH
jgi:hypothetical protein